MTKKIIFTLLILLGALIYAARTFNSDHYFPELSAGLYAGMMAENDQFVLLEVGTAGPLSVRISSRNSADLVLFDQIDRVSDLHSPLLFSNAQISLRLAGSVTTDENFSGTLQDLTQQKSTQLYLNRVEQTGSSTESSENSEQLSLSDLYARNAEVGRLAGQLDNWEQKNTDLLLKISELSSLVTDPEQLLNSSAADLDRLSRNLDQQQTTLAIKVEQKINNFKLPKPSVTETKQQFANLLSVYEGADSELLDRQIFDLQKSLIIARDQLYLAKNRVSK